MRSKISGTMDPVDASGWELLWSYEGFVHSLLGTYAKDDVIMYARQDVMFYRQSSNMSEKDSADTLWREAWRCGSMFSENRLKQHFIALLLPATRTHVRNHHMYHPNLSYREFVNSVEVYGKTYRKSCWTCDHEARGRAPHVRKPSRVNFVESLESSISGLYEDERNFLAGSFGSAPSRASSIPSTGTTTPSGQLTPKYSPIPFA